MLCLWECAYITSIIISVISWSKVQLTLINLSLPPQSENLWSWDLHQTLLQSGTGGSELNLSTATEAFSTHILCAVHAHMVVPEKQQVLISAQLCKRRMFRDGKYKERFVLSPITNMSTTRVFGWVFWDI